MNIHTKKTYTIDFDQASLDLEGKIVVKDNEDNFDYVTISTEEAVISVPKEIIHELVYILGKFNKDLEHPSN